MSRLSPHISNSLKHLPTTFGLSNSFTINTSSSEWRLPSSKPNLHQWSGTGRWDQDYTRDGSAGGWGQESIIPSIDLVSGVRSDFSSRSCLTLKMLAWLWVSRHGHDIWLNPLLVIEIGLFHWPESMENLSFFAVTYFLSRLHCLLWDFGEYTWN